MPSAFTPGDSPGVIVASRHLYGHGSGVLRIALEYPAVTQGGLWLRRRDRRQGSLAHKKQKAVRAIPDGPVDVMGEVPTLSA